MQWAEKWKVQFNRNKTKYILLNKIEVFWCSQVRINTVLQFGEQIQERTLEKSLYSYVCKQYVFHVPSSLALEQIISTYM